jgi:hypothetical protein
MAYTIAGIDVHKRMLAVVVADVALAEGGRLSDANLAAIPSSCARERRG